MSQISIKRPPHQRTTLATQVNEPSMLVQTAELRDGASQLADHATSLHADQQQTELAHRTTQQTQADPADVLRALSLDHGFSWPTLAKMVGVTTAAVRKWRRNGAVTAENRRRLAGVLAFCDFLEQVSPMISDPALWFDTPVLTETTLTHSDLYSRGLHAELLDIASQRSDPTAVLDAAEPGWRTHYAPDPNFEVVSAGDGIPSIVPRGTGA
jgi:DNA-binding transcriptional regulator YiaG